MCKRTTVRDIDVLFTEGPDDFLLRYESDNVLDVSGKLNDYYARTLCTDYYIKGAYAKVLTDLLFNKKIHNTSSQELDILFRSRLIDEAFQLTNHGYLKAIATLNRKNQLDYLGLPFDEFEPIPHQQGKHRERYAQEAYCEWYDFVGYDEGLTFQFLKMCLGDSE